MEKLVFVYNADSGLFNLGKDILHKVISPSTYPCKLCDLTFGVAGEKKSWAQFRAQLPVQQEYLHKDEFHKKYGKHSDPLPIIYWWRDGELKVFISDDEMNQCKHLSELERIIVDKLDVFSEGEA